MGNFALRLALSAQNTIHSFHPYSKKGLIIPLLKRVQKQVKILSPFISQARKSFPFPSGAQKKMELSKPFPFIYIFLDKVG